MANGNRRIPRSDNDLHHYIIATTNVLLNPGPPAGWERLRLTEAQKDEWKALHDAWVDAYGRCTDATKRTSVAISEKNAVRKRFTKFTYGILVRIQAHSGTTASDRAVFNLPARKKTRTRRQAMSDAPAARLENMQGAWMRLRVRMAGKEGRARVHPLADFMEVRYAILPPNTPAPRGAEECPEIVITTRAISTLKLPLETRGKVVHVFCRWVNSSEPQKSGPWSNGTQAFIV